jgi:hypothetical protein
MSDAAWIGLVIFGVFVGGFIGASVTAICAASKPHHDCLDEL